MSWPETLRVTVRVVVEDADEVEPPEGGRSTGAALIEAVGATAVLLARVCGRTRLDCAGGPSEEVGLTAGRVLVVVVDGGYRLVSLFGGSFVVVGFKFDDCRADDERERLLDAAEPLLNVLVVVEEAAVALRVSGLTGSRLGEPWRGSTSCFRDGGSLAMVVVEGFRRDRERWREEDMAPLVVCCLFTVFAG